MGVERINLCILLWDGAVTGQIALPLGNSSACPSVFLDLQFVRESF
jgi:hypothetical protein